MEDNNLSSVPNKKDSDFFLFPFLNFFGQFWQKIWPVPFLWAGERWGDLAEKTLEPIARMGGSIVGYILHPLFSNNHEHPLEPALLITRIVENSTSIKGEDFYLSEKKVIRRVYECPFKDKPKAKILCHLGESAGQELFSRLVPESKHKVHQTMARGSEYCEYSYFLNKD